MIRPYRFVVVREEGLRAFGDALIAAACEEDPTLPQEVAAKIAAKTRVAPVMVVLIASPLVGHKVVTWEQGVAAGCVGFGLLLAADLAGFGAVWKTAACMHGTALTTLLALQPDEHLLGWINVGTRARAAAVRRPIATAELTSRLDGAALTPWT